MLRLFQAADSSLIDYLPCSHQQQSLAKLNEPFSFRFQHILFNNLPLEKMHQFVCWPQGLPAWLLGSGRKHLGLVSFALKLCGLGLFGLGSCAVADTINKLEQLVLFNASRGSSFLIGVFCWERHTSTWETDTQIVYIYFYRIPSWLLCRWQCGVRIEVA